jgi:hypothetical protein
LDYWDDRLHGVPTDTRLTISPQHPSDDSLGDSSRYRRTDLPAALIERLRERSRQWGVTPFEILLAGWHLLLGRYTESVEISLPRRVILFEPLFIYPGLNARDPRIALKVPIV